MHLSSGIIQHDIEKPLDNFEWLFCNRNYLSSYKIGYYLNGIFRKKSEAKTFWIYTKVL